MKFEELFEQFDQMKKAFTQAKEKFDCDEVEVVFKTDDGEIIPINCVEGGYAAKENVNVLVLSSGREQFREFLEKMMGKQTVNAGDMDIGAKISMEELDGDH